MNHHEVKAGQEYVILKDGQSRSLIVESLHDCDEFCTVRYEDTGKLGYLMCSKLLDLSKDPMEADAEPEISFRPATLGCGKKKYGSREEAKSHMKRIRRSRFNKIENGPTHEYFCNNCQAFHWGHFSPDQRAIQLAFKRRKTSLIENFA